MTYAFGDNTFVPDTTEVAFRVGCRKCQNGVFGFYTTADKKCFVAICSECGHRIEIKPEILKDKPDEQPLNMRFFT